MSLRLLITIFKMSDQPSNNNKNELGFLNLLVIVLSLYVLIVLLLDTIFKLPPELSKLLYLIDNAICVFFLSEFCYRFYHTESKLKFMQWGWIDLVASIPTIHFLRAGRVFRLIRVFRIFRAFRSTHHLVHHIFKNRAQGTFTMVSISAILLVIFCSIAILQVEVDPNSNIKSAEDALWWSYVTITGVGYGDKFPVTTEGRIIGAILMSAGVGLFVTVSGLAASWFVTGKLEEKRNSKDSQNE